MQQRILSETPSLLNRFIAELRNIHIQKDSMRFRRNMERIGEIFAYEISKTLNYKEVKIETPLGILGQQLSDNAIVLATVLRAGLPLHQGFLNYFDRAENAFIGAYRQYTADHQKFDIQSDYLSSPSIEGKVLILMDPMLATGSSMLLAYKSLLQRGQPLHTHIVCPIASRKGADYLQAQLSEEEITLWLGEIDPGLTDKSYIVPGLGDAGDLAFGCKL
ncbi:MAG: uracil phosphoribosyltransferase [Bacteroidales bacterium]|nr:uracil phosphoribosyltransferase [Bacteroidales bacterium]MCL2132962.1 uracil phosphoribosyltransferase [Bacteroidales bacterium]